MKPHALTTCKFKTSQATVSKQKAVKAPPCARLRHGSAEVILSKHQTWNACEAFAMVLLFHTLRHNWSSRCKSCTTQYINACIVIGESHGLRLHLQSIIFIIKLTSSIFLTLTVASRTALNQALSQQEKFAGRLKHKHVIKSRICSAWEQNVQPRSICCL